MSLKFGIYLVEQRIITPEQFCGLVKVQQEATMSVATIALRKNILTINQVSRILDIQEEYPEKSFVQIATECDFMDVEDANMLLRAQELTCPSIQKLVVECGLLTQRQASVLSQHFERLPVGSPSDAQAPARRSQPNAQPAHAGQSSPPSPKYRQRPVIVNPYVNTGF